jgi:hypothetical protein
MVSVGKDEEFELTKETCEEELRGFFLPAVGCIVNAKQPYVAKDGTVTIFPLKAKKLPVIIRKEDFLDISTDAGSWSNVYTYALK